MAPKERETLFVIGAGCSKNYDTSHNGVDDLQSPINSDFFKMSKKALLSSSLIEENSKAPLKGLFEKICTERGMIYNNNYDFLDEYSLIDLEAVMTEIDTGGALFENRFAVRDKEHPYNVLVELIAFTLTRALRGPPCPLHKKLANLICDKDVVFDFNYDLLMDNALKTEGKLNDRGYNINFFRTLEGQNWKWPSGENGSINFFKLHGSLNWLKCIECSSIFKNDTLNDSDMFTINRILPNNLHCPECGSKSDRIVRLLLPPIQTKEYDKDPYRLLWRRASMTLEKINRIAFLGYSFSNTDYATRCLLRQINRSTPIEKLKIHFMDPSSDPEERFKIFSLKLRIQQGLIT